MKAPQKLDLKYHIWANVIQNECKCNVTKEYWSNVHKPIHIAFKLLLNTFPMCNKKPLMCPFL